MAKRSFTEIPRIKFLDDRWPFIILAILLSILVIFTSGFQKDAVSSEYDIVKGRVLTADNSGLKDDPYIEGMRLGKQVLTIELIGGTHKGERFKVENAMSRAFNINAREGLVILCNVREDAGAVVGLDVFGYNRDGMVYTLLAIFLAILLLIGRKKGLYSAISLAFTMIFIIFFLLPRILEGYHPVAMALIAAAVTTAISIFIVSGWNIKSFAAVIGILGGVLIAGLIAIVAGYFGNLSGLHMAESQEVIYLAPEIPIRVPELLAASIIISALGAIMDVAITISSAIFEVKTANIKLGMPALYRSGMNVGRDAMGTMSNTLILAFAGSSLNILIIIVLYNLPYLRLINLDLLNIEILQGLAGSIGLTLTVPLTALCAAAFAAKAKKLPDVS